MMPSRMGSTGGGGVAGRAKELSERKDSSMVEESIRFLRSLCLVRGGEKRKVGRGSSAMGVLERASRTGRKVRER